MFLFNVITVSYANKINNYFNKINNYFCTSNFFLPW